MAEKAKAKSAKPRPASEAEGVTRAKKAASKRLASDVTPQMPAVKPSKRAVASKGAKPSTRGSSAKSDLTTVRLELSVDCDRCMRPIVLSEITERVTCRACLHVLDLPTPLWSRAKRGFEEALAGGRGSRRFATEATSAHTVRACVERQRATCACGAELDEQTLIAALELGPRATCSCGKTMSVRGAAPLLAMAKGALLLANERVDSVRPTSAARPVAFRCACGASLQADGTRRAIDCSSCGPVDVPEPLWDTLRPVLPRSPMFLVLGKAKAQ